METRFFVYILASKRNGTLYVGVTNNLARRMSEHEAKLVPGFTRQYGIAHYAVSNSSTVGCRIIGKQLGGSHENLYDDIARRHRNWSYR
jgi:hypothetical protein